MGLPPIKDLLRDFSARGVELPPLLPENTVVTASTHCRLPRSRNVQVACSQSQWDPPRKISPRRNLTPSTGPTTPTLSPNPNYSTLDAEEAEQSSASPAEGHPSRHDVPEYTLLSQDNLAHQRTVALLQGMSRDERYERFHRAPFSSTYGDRVAKAKETRLSRKPLREDFRDDSSYQKGLKRYAEGENHRRKEQQRRTRHFEMQKRLHKMTCEDARLLAYSDPVLVAARNGDMSATTTATGGGCKAAGKDDQLMSNIYQNHMALEVCRSEHEGRLEAEAILARYRRMYGNLIDNPTTPSKRCRIDQHYNSSPSPRHPLSPSPSPTI